MFKAEGQEEDDVTAKIMSELDEIKRYSAASYDKVDSEISEIQSALRRIEQKLNETDRQIDKIEQFERSIQEIKSSTRNMERKIK